MTNRSSREALRGAEEETFDILAEVMTSEQWGELLRAPLEYAAAEGNRDIAQKLVGAGAEIGDALHAAAGAFRAYAVAGHEQIVADLLENGASVAAKDTDGRTPLHAAAGQGTTEMVQLLLLKGADKDALDDSEFTPLYLAISSDDAGAAQALLAAGADVGLRYGEDEESVLHAAAEHGHPHIARAAIERGADVDAVDSAKRTPLHIAALFDKVAAIDMLVEAGANMDAWDVDGYTPLHCAASSRSLKAAPALLKHGADIDTQGRHQSTPLHFAAAMAGKQGAAEVVDFLLRSGADETILNDEGNAAADVVGSAVYEGDRNCEETINRVLELLANAPADRAWRRRGYLVLCRTHPDRMKQIANAGATRFSTTKLGRTETGNCTGTAGGDTADGQSGGEWAGVVATVLGLQEEGIFRTIVGYL